MTPDEKAAFDQGEGPVTADEARARVAKFHDDPKHKFIPGPDGKDPRDEATREAPLPEGED